MFQEWKVVLRRLCVEDELVLLGRDEGGFPAGLTTGLEQWQGKRVSCAGFLTLVPAALVPVVQQTCAMSVHIFTPSIFCVFARYPLESSSVDTPAMHVMIF